MLCKEFKIDPMQCVQRDYQSYCEVFNKQYA